MRGSKLVCMVPCRGFRFRGLGVERDAETFHFRENLDYHLCLNLNPLPASPSGSLLTSSASVRRE